MGISYLSRFCAAVFLAATLSPALAATDKPNYFYNAATKTWIPSRDAVITPQGTIINNSAAVQAQRYLDGQGGFVNKSTVHANFPAVKKTVPITIDAKTPPSKTKLAAKNLLKGGVAGIVLSEGLNQLFNGLDWVMGEGGKIQRVDTVPSSPDDGGGMWCAPGGTPCSGSPQGFVANLNARGPSDWQWPYTFDGQSNHRLAHFRNAQNGRGNISRSVDVECSPPYSFNSDYHCVLTSTFPVADNDIDTAVDSSYAPTVDDWDWLAPYMDPTAIEITDLPRLMSPPVTKTIYDADGNPVQVSETNIWHDFDIRNNDSTQPEIDVKTTEETKVYEGGTLVSTNTTTSTSSADPDAAPSADGGGDFEIPTDCDFMPTVCAFIDWFKDDDLGDEPDLKSIMKDDEDFAKTKTISFGAAVCPAPYTIQIPSLGMSADLSFEFFCQFAEYAKALVLAAAYIFAAYISLGVARG